MKVKELIALLKKYDSNAVVLGAFEGVFVDLQENNFYSGNNHLLLIDFDSAYYKGKWENRLEGIPETSR